MRDVVRSTNRPNLWLLPGNKRTKTAETILAVERRGVDTLSDVLSYRIDSQKLHYVVLDTAPSAGGMQENALYMTDLLIIPAAVDFLALEGVAEVLKTLRSLGRRSPPMTWILPTFYDEVTRESETSNRSEGVGAQPLLGGFSFQTANGGWPATRVKAV
jgi:chromosome partitioning protein